MPGGAEDAPGAATGGLVLMQSQRSSWSLSAGLAFEGGHLLAGPGLTACAREVAKVQGGAA